MNWRKWITPAALLTTAFIIVFSLQQTGKEHQLRQQNRAEPRGLSPEMEIRSKERLVVQDVQMTDGLCRRQCRLDLQRIIAQMPKAPSADARQYLQQAFEQNGKLQKLFWSPRQTSFDGGLVVGSSDEQVSVAVRPYLFAAKQATDNGNVYESKAISVGADRYFVVGVPSGGGESSLIGIVKQDILRQVTELQMKNLRAVPYPADGNWTIESVDSDTLQDVQVNHPEDNEGTSHYHVREVVVKFKSPPDPQTLAKIKRDIGAVETQRLGNTYVFRSQSLDSKQMMTYFKTYEIEYVEPHFLYLTNETARSETFNEQTAQSPNDTLYADYQWNLPITQTERGWNVTKGSNDVIVAVIDTGVDLNHPDLQGRLVEGYNAVNPNSPPQDDVGHGTHVAGVVSATVNNAEGVAGMSWYNPVMPVKVLDHTGAGSTYAVAEGIIWAVDHGAKVINLSLGNYAEANFLHDAIKYAFDRDVVIVAASGNDNTSKPGYPAAYPEVLAVAATDYYKRKASFSNYGDYIDVAAPGVSIASTYPNKQYAALSGTSMASPHVAALAALIRSANPDMKNTEVMELIRNTAVDLGEPGKDIYYGYGQIDVAQAVTRLTMQNVQPEYWWQRLLDRLRPGRTSR